MSFVCVLFLFCLLFSLVFVLAFACLLIAYVFKCSVYFLSCFFFVSLGEAMEKKWKDSEGKYSGSVLSRISSLSASVSLIILFLH